MLEPAPTPLVHASREKAGKSFHVAGRVDRDLVSSTLGRCPRCGVPVVCSGRSCHGRVPVGDKVLSCGSGLRCAICCRYVWLQVLPQRCSYIVVIVRCPICCRCGWSRSAKLKLCDLLAKIQDQLPVLWAPSILWPKACTGPRRRRRAAPLRRTHPCTAARVRAPSRLHAVSVRPLRPSSHRGTCPSLACCH